MLIFFLTRINLSSSISALVGIAHYDFDGQSGNSQRDCWISRTVINPAHVPSAIYQRKSHPIPLHFRHNCMSHCSSHGFFKWNIISGVLSNSRCQSLLVRTVTTTTSIITITTTLIGSTAASAITLQIERAHQDTAEKELFWCFFIFFCFRKAT